MWALADEGDKSPNIKAGAQERFSNLSNSFEP
jgi:hypothetical protein